MKRVFLKFLTVLSGVAFLASCNISPVAIDYNEDQCHACKMTISDSRFGAELVTKKGKIYKFDAAECMVREVNKKGDELYEFIMVTDFKQPKKLIDARTSTFLISENQPSPMGGDLSAYQSQSEGKNALAEKGGQLYSWEELKVQEQFNY